MEKNASKLTQVSRIASILHYGKAILVAVLVFFFISSFVPWEIYYKYYYYIMYGVPLVANVIMGYLLKRNLMKTLLAGVISFYFSIFFVGVYVDRMYEHLLDPMVYLIPILILFDPMYFWRIVFILIMVGAVIGGIIARAIPIKSTPKEKITSS